MSVSGSRWVRHIDKTEGKKERDTEIGNTERKRDRENNKTESET
jgi:hypothetical protein